MTGEVINFGAGPAKLPREVLLEVQKEILNCNNHGISVMEMSHRAANYEDIHNNTISLFKELLNIPDNYKVLFMHGGGNGLFSAIPFNLMARTGEADYIVTGTWSKIAAEEAKKYGTVNQVLTLETGKELPDQSTWNLSPKASYLYYCANETVEGFEFPFIPENIDVPIVCDMSSNIATKVFDVSKFGLIFFGVQKNLGPAGVATVIIREDLIAGSLPQCPKIFEFASIAKINSLLNTPPTFVIYVVGKVLEYIKRNGGIAEMEKLSAIKSQLVYDVIDDSEGFYTNNVHPKYRSRINVTFRIKGGLDVEKKFLKLAEEQLNMIQLKGHRLVGGIRASLYNAITVEETAKLVGFMRLFQSEYKFDVTEEKKE